MMMADDSEVLTFAYYEDIQAGDHIVHIVTLFGERWDEKLMSYVPDNHQQITVRRPKKVTVEVS